MTTDQFGQLLLVVEIGFVVVAALVIVGFIAETILARAKHEADMAGVKLLDTKLDHARQLATEHHNALATAWLGAKGEIAELRQRLEALHAGDVKAAEVANRFAAEHRDVIVARLDRIAKTIGPPSVMFDHEALDRLVSAPSSAILDPATGEPIREADLPEGHDSLPTMTERRGRGGNRRKPPAAKVGS